MFFFFLIIVIIITQYRIHMSTLQSSAGLFVLLLILIMYSAGKTKQIFIVICFLKTVL